MITDRVCRRRNTTGGATAISRTSGHVDRFGPLVAVLLHGSYDHHRPCSALILMQPVRSTRSRACSKAGTTPWSRCTPAPWRSSGCRTSDRTRSSSTPTCRTCRASTRVGYSTAICESGTQCPPSSSFRRAHAGTARGRPAERRLGFSPLPAGPCGAPAQPRDLPAGETEHRRRAGGTGGSGDGLHTRPALARRARSSER